jgi:hypothetical protein
MVAHLAVAEVDQDIVDALRVLAAEPADLASADGFVDRPHPLPASVRRRLLDELDLFGIAHGVLALRDKPGAGPATVRAMLRRRSGLDGVCAALPLAEAGYRRIRGAVDALETMAVTADPATAMRVGEFLAGDAAVIARMACALEVMGDSGLDVERGDDALAGAVRWERYTTGPVGPMHQACGADIARGSLRIWRRAATR